MDYDAMLKVDEKYVADPQPGDFWHEMYSPYCVVIDVDKKRGVVWICQKKKDVDADHWTWDLDTVEKVSMGMFKGIVKYANVAPGAHLWVPAHFLETATPQ